MLGASGRERKDQIIVFVDPEIRKQLQALSKQTHVPMSALVRGWIEEGLKWRELGTKEKENE